MLFWYFKDYITTAKDIFFTKSSLQILKQRFLKNRETRSVFWGDFYNWCNRSVSNVAKMLLEFK